MPELPEVETVRRGLQALLVGREVADLDVLSPKSFQATGGADITRDLIGARVAAARRRGKVLIVDLSSGAALVGHLKMTGQMVVRGPQNWGGGHPTDSMVGELPDRSTRVIVRFTDGTTLYFNDQRKFGWLHLMPAGVVGQIDLIKRMGPEPLDPDEAVWPEFHARVRRHGATTIKAAILNQEVLAGVGNIYADESLFAARIHPSKRVDDVSDRKLHELLREAARVMRLSIDHGGSTDRNYVDAEGRRGNYLDGVAQVFRREGRPCPRCGTAIVKTRVAGRGTHICPKCQKL